MKIDVAEPANDGDRQQPLQDVQRGVVACGRLQRELHDEHEDGARAGKRDALAIAFAAEITPENGEDRDQGHDDVQHGRGQSGMGLCKQVVGFLGFEIV